jgi:hypothetical protein
MGVGGTPGRDKHNARKGRESVAKKLGERVAAQLKARDGHQCAYCKANEHAEARAGKRMHLDHVKPRDAGGKDHPKNLVVACNRCNDTRKEMPLAEWAAYAKKNLGLNFTAEEILAKAAKKLPPPSTANRDKAAEKEHTEAAKEHEKLGKSLPDDSAEQRGHEIAGVAHRLAANAAREGRYSPEHRAGAEDASRLAHARTGTDKPEKDGPGVKHGSDGRFVAA